MYHGNLRKTEELGQWPGWANVIFIQGTTKKNGADPENLHVTYIDKFSTKQLPDQTYKLLVPLYHKKSKNPTWMEFWPSQEVIFSCACLVSAVNDN